ncbi:MAG: alpha/beta fold hydrolase, partial [Frankiaceae bacterium]
MRARDADYQGEIRRDGVCVGYDVYDSGRGRTGATILLLTSWAIVHARQWKAQVPYLARHFRVVCVEGRGNGRADRPPDDEAYRFR